MFVVSCSKDFTKSSALDTCGPVERRGWQSRPLSMGVWWVSKYKCSNQEEHWASQDQTLLLQILWSKEPAWSVTSSPSLTVKYRREGESLCVCEQRGKKQRIAKELKKKKRRRPWLYAQGLPSLVIPRLEMWSVTETDAVHCPHPVFCLASVPALLSYLVLISRLH